MLDPGSGARRPPHGCRQAVLGKPEDTWIDARPTPECVVGTPFVSTRPARWSARTGPWIVRRCRGRDADPRPPPRASRLPARSIPRPRAPATVTPSTSATMRGQRSPLAAPPVNTMLRTVCPVSSSMMRRCPRVAKAACSSTARMQALRSVRAGSATSKPMNDGGPWTQRLTSITLENSASRPLAPGGTLEAASSMTRYASTPRRSASARSGSHIASRSQRRAMPPVERDALGHPLPRHRVTQCPDPSLGIDERACP